MCFFTKQSHDAVALKNKFEAEFETPNEFKTSNYINAFTYPKTPVITNQNGNLIKHYQWGLIPHWAKNKDIRKYTLNAKIETLREKPSFKSSLSNRCLVIVDGFYEWKWLDGKGKNKQKYLITLPDDGLFAFAGLYSAWENRSTGEILNTYTIITTEANELMSKIHNNKKRMPVILNKTEQYNWLNNQNYLDFKHPEIKLKAAVL